MCNSLKELRALNAFVKKRSIEMQRKLMLYWVSMILMVFTAVILLLSIAGAFSRDNAQLHEAMDLHLNNTRDTLASYLNHLTAQSLNLSKELSREIEVALVQEGISLQAVNDDLELHNRSIYEKLEVISRDKLMLYINLLRRCRRLRELF